MNTKLEKLNKFIATMAQRSILGKQKKKDAGTCWCSAINCQNNKREMPTMAFFRFPKDPIR
jgi:hypothetical protein